MSTVVDLVNNFVTHAFRRDKVILEAVQLVSSGQTEGSFA